MKKFINYIYFVSNTVLCGLSDTKKSDSSSLEVTILLEQDVSVCNKRMAYNKMVGKSEAKICDRQIKC